MRIVIQRVAHASVTIEGEVKSAIKQGYLVLLGIEESDTIEDIDWLVRKVIGLRLEITFLCGAGSFKMRKLWFLYKLQKSFASF